MRFYFLGAAATHIRQRRQQLSRIFRQR